MDQDDVTTLENNQAVTETQPAETETATPPAGGEKETTEATVPQAGAEETGKSEPTVESLTKQVDNLNKALSIEREARKKAQRSTADFRGSRNLEGYDAQDLEQVMQHPFVQDLLLKQAENELRVGAQDILEQYPQVPKSIASAIIKNPRGYVQPGTTDVQNALLDIQDYLEGIAGEFETPADGQNPQPKTVPIMGNNQQLGSQDSLEVQIQEIMKIPPEAWTKEQEKAVDEYLKKNKK